MEKKPIIALQISNELYNKLKYAATEREMSLSAFIRIILLNYFKTEADE